MRSKYARKKYYEVVARSTGKVISRHYKLANAHKAVRPYGSAVRVRDQDGRYFL